MQIITRGQNNTVIFTLTERVTISSPYFLMKCTSRSSRTTKIFILASNQSSYTERYDKFTITESANEILTSGTVELKPTGDWDYEIYQQASASNLNVVNSGILLEQGIIRVIGTGDTTTYYNGQTTGYTYYGTGSV